MIIDELMELIRQLVESLIGVGQNGFRGFECFIFMDDLVETVCVDAALYSGESIFIQRNGSVVVSTVNQVEAPGFSFIFRAVFLSQDDARIVFGRGKSDAGRNEIGTPVDLLFMEVGFLIPGTEEIHRYEIFLPEVDAIG